MRADMVRRARYLLLSIVVLGIVAGLVSSWQSAAGGIGPAWLRKLAGPPQTLAGMHIGIVAGHMGFDTGTVCSDGLTEAETNRAIADRVVRGLAARGAQVDLLKEYDERLAGYTADAFVSIHADSCQSQLSGYKVASLDGGTQASARLEGCLWRTYSSATGLAENRDTVTVDMRDYHAFNRIAAGTPAAIIETGFLNADRRLLTTRQDLAASGIIAGVECFLAPTPAATSRP